MPKTKLPAPTGRPTWAQALSDREARYVAAYASSLNSTDAALAAGYGRGDRKSAAEIASRLRRRPDVAAAIAQYIGDFTGATKSRILEELAKVAFSDFTDFATLQPDGSLVMPAHITLSDDQRKAIASVEEHVTESGYRTLKIRLHDKLAALALLVKATGMSITKHEVTATVTGHVEHERVHSVADRVRARFDELAARQAAALPAPSPMIDITPAAVVDPVPAEAR